MDASLPTLQHTTSTVSTSPPLLPPPSPCICRRSLNIITAFAITMDAHGTTRVPLLTPHAEQLEALLSQLKESFKAMAAMVAGEGSAEW